MNWLFEGLGQTIRLLGEPQVDCTRCQVQAPLKRKNLYRVETKCCEFSPFWSSFAVGAFLELQGTEGQFQSLWDQGAEFSVLGILHPVSHRRESQSLCLHFDRAHKNCSIWSQRPGTCLSFYCTSQYQEGLKSYEALENWLLRYEAKALQIWFDHLKLPKDLWSLWAEFMEEFPKESRPPEGLLLNSWQEAQSLYIKSWKLFKEDALFASFREQALRSWQKQVADSPILC